MRRRVADDSFRDINYDDLNRTPGRHTGDLVYLAKAYKNGYLMLKRDEYHNIWPIYVWQKISGTTVMQKPKLHGVDNIQLDGLTDFVWAVTDGLYGALAFDYKSAHDHMEAKKSWFFFDEEYVRLSADIKSLSNSPLATTVNQVLMRTMSLKHKATKTIQIKVGGNNFKKQSEGRAGD